jgi:hypothetical protein
MKTYLLQCLRLNGELSGWSEWELGQMDDADNWSSSPTQALFFNFRVSETQIERVKELHEEFDIRFDRSYLISNPEFEDFAIQVQNNQIIDIRENPIWEDLISKTPKPVTETPEV